MIDEIIIMPAPIHPIIVGMLTSSNIPPAIAVPSTAFWIVISSPSRAAAKQQTTRPYITRINILLPPKLYIVPIDKTIRHKSNQYKDEYCCNYSRSV